MPWLPNQTEFCESFISAESAEDFFTALTTGFAAVGLGVGGAALGLGPLAAIFAAAVPAIIITSTIAREALDLAPAGTCPVAIYEPNDFTQANSFQNVETTLGNVFREDGCYEECPNSASQQNQQSQTGSLTKNTNPSIVEKIFSTIINMKGMMFQNYEREKYCAIFMLVHTSSPHHEK